ncbi:prostaglandin D2 receptor-like protein [Cricetulus griseus]|nr:prostaglandin D2 receptor-like protein [Cricetulus griseus]
MHITLRQYVRSFCLAFCALPFAGFGKFVQYCPGTWRFIQMVHEKRSLSVLSFSVLYSSLMALLVLTTVLCNLYTMHWRLRRHPRSCLRDQAQAGSGPRQESQHPLEELEPPVAGSEDSALRFMVSAFNFDTRDSNPNFALGIQFPNDALTNYCQLNGLKLYGSIMVGFWSSEFKTDVASLSCHELLESRSHPEYIHIGSVQDTGKVRIT